MSKLEESKKVKNSHRRFYLKREDIPRDYEGGVIIYDTPKQILTINSISGLNYQAVSKELSIVNLVHQWHIEEALRAELTSERIRSNILAKRMIEAGLSTTLTPEEIKDYSTSLSAALIEDIDTVMERAPRSVSDEIFCRVKKELAEVSYDIKSDYAYNVLRIDNVLSYYDTLLGDVMTAQDRRIPLKDKASIMQKLGKDQREYIKLKKEVIADLGLSLRDADKPKESEAVTDNGGVVQTSPKVGSLSGALKKNIPVEVAPPTDVHNTVVPNSPPLPTEEKPQSFDIGLGGLSAALGKTNG